MDNRIFNVNGETKIQLKLAVDLLMLGCGHKTIEGWYFLKNKGLVLTWHVTKDKYKAIPFTDRMGKPCAIGSDELVEILWNWLKTDEAKQVSCTGWDADVEHDGSNDSGWRLYTEDWGCIHEGDKEFSQMDDYSLAAFKQAYIWYGK